MEEVEKRERRPKKTEQRPKPVVGLSELDLQDVTQEVKADEGYAIWFDSERQDGSTAECNENERMETNCNSTGKDKGIMGLNCSDHKEDVFPKVRSETIDSKEDVNVSDRSCSINKRPVNNADYSSPMFDVLHAKSGMLSERAETEIKDNIQFDETRDGYDYFSNNKAETHSGLKDSLSDITRHSNQENVKFVLNDNDKQEDIVVISKDTNNPLMCSESKEPTFPLRSKTDDGVTSALFETRSKENINVETEGSDSHVLVKNQLEIEGNHNDISRPGLEIPIRCITLPNKKDVHRAGYLYKQGGVDRNQGWKRRWFTFDAKALKYYRDQKSSASLRIIPVALMKSVSPANENGQKPRLSGTVTDLFPASNRQHQFILECKQRTFLFGTDSIEKCQQWQSSLMAAIIEYQKCGISDIPYGGEMSSPDISGMVKFDNCKTKYFVALKGEKLRYYYNLEDYSVDCPIHELSMERISVKEVRKTALQLDSPPDQTFVLHFDHENDAIQWKTYIETAISRALGDDKILQKVREKEENRSCADCSSSDAEWASINLGIVLCTKCAGPHRSLGVNRSKVRSLRMDNLFKENENVLQLLEDIGNKNSNLFWNKNSENARVIDGETPAIIRQKHIEEKYLKKKFADVLQFDSKQELDMELYSAVKANNIIAVMVALFSGADINFKCSEQNKTVVEVANETDNEALKAFLEQNKYTDVAVIHADNPVEKEFTGTAKKTSIYHEGYLDKTGPNLKGYLRRWCVLHYGRITYFSEKQGSEKGFVDLVDTASVSIVTGQRQHSFDISPQSNKRTYRFAAPDVTALGKWLNVLIQVISPFDHEGQDGILMAGYFFFKKQLQFWAKVWVVLQDHSLHIRHRDDPNIDTISISSHMKCLQYNVGKHLEKTNDVIKQLDSNQTIELISSEGHVVAYLQGMTLKDTKRMFALLESVIRGQS